LAVDPVFALVEVAGPVAVAQAYGPLCALPDYRVYQMINLLGDPYQIPLPLEMVEPQALAAPEVAEEWVGPLVEVQEAAPLVLPQLERDYCVELPLLAAPLRSQLLPGNFLEDHQYHGRCSSAQAWLL
jgi:hypothetical protein